MRPAALTIDLDYWQKDPHTNYGISSCEKFLKNICGKYKGEIQIYREHDHMVEDLNKTEYTTLINIDQHDDLADDIVDPHPNECHSGNWPFFLRNRRDLEYVWCSDPDCAIRVPGYNAHKFYGFKKYTEKDGIDLDLLRRVDLKFIGVCYSADWVDPISICDGLCWLLRQKNCRIEKLDFDCIMRDMLGRATPGEDFFCGSMSLNERIAKGVSGEKSLCL